VTVQLIRKGKLREEYALVWLAASVGILILSIFGWIVNFLAAAFAVSYAPTLVLVLGLLFALAVLLSQSVSLSAHANRVRDLAQNVTLLEWRLRQLEHEQPVGTVRIANSAGDESHPTGDRPIRNLAATAARRSDL
jgi:hypothetical protein